MNVSLFISEDYRKIDDFAYQKNKPKQTQFSTPQNSAFASGKKQNMKKYQKMLDANLYKMCIG